MVPSDTVCGRCHQPLMQKSFREANLLVCTACKTVLLAQSDFERLLVQREAVPLYTVDLQLEEDDLVTSSIERVPVSIPQNPQEFPAPSRPPLLLFGVLAALVVSSSILFVLAGITLYLGRPSELDGVFVHPRVTDDQPILPIVKPHDVQVPEPAPIPPAVPAVLPVEAPSIRSLVKKGWSTVDTDPKLAAASFLAALAKQPGHTDANYGYGYALLATGRPIDARPYLCRALTHGDAEIKREIRALLSRNQLTCN